MNIVLPFLFPIIFLFFSLNYTGWDLQTMLNRLYKRVQHFFGIREKAFIENEYEQSNTFLLKVFVYIFYEDEKCPTLPGMLKVLTC